MKKYSLLKKLAVTAIISAMTVSMFSCAAEEEVFDRDLNMGIDSSVVDFEGQKLNIMTGWPDEWKPESGFTSMGDNLIARYNEMEEKYNLTINIYKNPVAYSTHIMTSVAAGTDDVPDIVDCHANEIYSIYEMGMLYAYDDISTIDINDEKWGNKNFIRYGYFDGKQYGAFPYHWEFMPAILGVCMWDDSVLRDAGISQSPHEMLESGTWTWDNFEKLLEQATYEDGDFKVVGLGYGNDTQLAQTVLFSNGAQIINENENGKASFGLTDEKAYKAFDWLASLNSKKIIKPLGYGQFNNHEMLFFVGESYYFTHMTQTHIDGDTPVYKHDGYGFITFTAGPDGEYGLGGSYITQGRRLNWLVDAGPMQKDDLGVAMNILFEPLEGTNEKAWIDFLERNVFYHGSKDKEMFLKMVENTKYDWSSPLGSKYSKITSAFTSLISGKNTPSAAFEAIESTVNEALNK